MLFYFLTTILSVVGLSVSLQTGFSKTRSYIPVRCIARHGLIFI